MDFTRHRQTVMFLLVTELTFALVPALERGFGLYLLVGVICLAASYWFVFGRPGWWLYRYAGIAYAVYITVDYMLAAAGVLVPRTAYHLGLALLWGAVLAAHHFIARAFTPRPGR